LFISSSANLLNGYALPFSLYCFSCLLLSKRSKKNLFEYSILVLQHDLQICLIIVENLDTVLSLNKFKLYKMKKTFICKKNIINTLSHQVTFNPGLAFILFQKKVQTKWCCSILNDQKDTVGIFTKCGLPLAIFCSKCQEVYNAVYAQKCCISFTGCRQQTTLALSLP